MYIIKVKDKNLYVSDFTYLILLPFEEFRKTTKRLICFSESAAKQCIKTFPNLYLEKENLKRTDFEIIEIEINLV